ncbi:MAG: FUSC family protein [Acidimicrobiales bacterium]
MSVIKSAWRTTIRTDLAFFEHLRPIRSALVVFVVLTLVDQHRDTRALLPLGIGMLFASIADRGVSLRRRMTSMGGATVGITFGTGIGCLISDNQPLHIAIAGVLAGLCGLIGAAGVPSMTAGVLTLVVLTIFSGAPVDLLDWRSNSLLMLLGACIMIGSVLLEFVIFATLRRKRTAANEMPTTPYSVRLREHFHWNDDFVLHSFRLAIVIIIAISLEEVLDFPHSSWIPMTVAWISRPDRDGTVERVTLRVAGTLLGVAVAGSLIGLTQATSAESLFMIGLATYIVLAFIAPNYALAVTGMTVFTFLLFHLVGYPLDGSVATYITSTLIAAVLVLVAIRIQPRKARKST